MQYYVEIMRNNYANTCSLSRYRAYITLLLLFFNTTSGVILEELLQCRAGPIHSLVGSMGPAKKTEGIVQRRVNIA